MNLVREILDKRILWIDRIRGKMPEQLLVVILSVITGIAAGFFAWLLKHILDFFSWLVFSDIPMELGDWRLLVFPVVGILLAMIYQRYIIHKDVSHGTDQITAKVQPGSDYRISPWVTINSIIGCGMTVGMGGSAGSEGPLAYTGASVGSSMAQFFKLSSPWMRVMIGVGAGAGIAAIFKAPIGGTLYTLEVLKMELNVMPIMALIIACIMASVTSFMLSDFTFDWAFIMEAEFDPASLGWMFLLGIFCGLYSIWYSSSIRGTNKMFGKIANPWVKALIAGVMTAIALYTFPLLFGEGCSIVDNIINGGRLNVYGLGPFVEWGGDHPLYLLLILVILLIKGPLVSAANSGGGVAGSFVPALYIGGIAGYLFGMLLQNYMGVDVPIWYTSLAGMGAVLGCASRAPLMSLFLMCETTNSFQYMPAYLVTIATSYIVMEILTGDIKRLRDRFDKGGSINW